MVRTTERLIITQHAEKRYRERISKKKNTEYGIGEMYLFGRLLNRLPTNRYNIRFFTKYYDCDFYKYNQHVLVAKQDTQGTIAVTVLDWNSDMKRCLY